MNQINKRIGLKRLEKLKINRYRMWGLFYISTLIFFSPVNGFSSELITNDVIRQIQIFHKEHLSGFLAYVDKQDLIQKYSLQALVCNFALILFSVVETFLNGRKTWFDILASLFFGAAAILNFGLFFAIYTNFDFLWVTLVFSAFYSFADVVGVVISRNSEPEKVKTFKYSLAFIDAPTLIVCGGFLVPTLSQTKYPESFTDGVGAAILLFSGVAWASLMVFYVAPEEARQEAELGFRNF